MMIFARHNYDANNYTIVYLNAEFKVDVTAEKFTCIAWVIDKDTKEIQVCVEVEFVDGNCKEMWFKESEFEFRDFFQQRVNADDNH